MVRKVGTTRFEPMTIEPDSKDWTWVLERSCPECGFDSNAVSRENLADRLETRLKRWPTVWLPRTVGSGRERRPGPRWNTPAIREVAILMRERPRLILTEDEAKFAGWDQDEAAVSGAYGTQSPPDVAAGIRVDGAALVSAFRAVPVDGWSCKGLRSNGSAFSAYTLGVYTLHDLEHHLWDVTDAAAHLN